eukprot:7327817-Karenia_brevis.AAC.1
MLAHHLLDPILSVVVPGIPAALLARRTRTAALVALAVAQNWIEVVMENGVLAPLSLLSCDLVLQSSHIVLGLGLPVGARDVQ